VQQSRLHQKVGGLKMSKNLNINSFMLDIFWGVKVKKLEGIAQNGG
jgi:hypothetical protein